MAYSQDNEAGQHAFERAAAMARAEVMRMRAVADKVETGTMIRMPVEQFTRLANMLEDLAVGARRDVDPDGFDAPADGFRFWIPADHVERELAELARLRETERRRVEQILPLRLAS